MKALSQICELLVIKFIVPWIVSEVSPRFLWDDSIVTDLWSALLSKLLCLELWARFHRGFCGMTALSQICEVPCYQSFGVLNCERGFVRLRHCCRFVKCLLPEFIVSWIVSEVFAKPFIRRRHCRRFVKCLLAQLIVSWIVSEVSPSFALFQTCECLFSRFVVSSYGRGFADNLYDKSVVVVCKFYFSSPLWLQLRVRSRIRLWV